MTSYENTQFHIKLKLLRLEHGLTQTELAKILGVSRGCLANYETDKRQPDTYMLNRIAEYFDVSVDYLINRIEIRTAHQKDEQLKIYQRMDNIIKRYGNTLDLSSMSPRGKIAVIEFFEYINMKENYERGCKTESHLKT